MNGAALAASIGGPVVGIAGVVFGWLSARGQREHAERLAQDQHEHERALARDVRLNDEAREAYEQLLRMIYIVEAHIDRTNPIIGPAQEPPAMPPESEMRNITARVSVVGSEAIIEAITKLWEAQRDFWIYSQTLDSLREQTGAPPDAWKRVQDAREEFRARARELEAAIRTEVRA
jgi:hypothetical protein